MLVPLSQLCWQEWTRALLGVAGAPWHWVCTGYMLAVSSMSRPKNAVQSLSSNLSTSQLGASLMGDP